MVECGPGYGSGFASHRSDSTYALKKVEDVTEIITQADFSRFIYTRGSHPNEIVLEERIAALEGGEAALAFASGVSALKEG